MSKTLLVPLLLVFVLSTGLYSYNAAAQDEAPPVAPGRFAGKVALIYVKGGDPESGVTIFDAKFEKVRDRWFLTGAYPEIDDPDDWLRGSWGAVDWDRVESYYLMTPEQFKKQVVGDDFAQVMPL